PELKMSVGTGGLADDFITKMTEWYKGRLEIRDGTRTSGEKVLRSLCINWLAGTTREWLIDSLGQNNIEGGFLGRCVTVEAKYNDLRFRRPLYPPDYDEVMEHLKARFRALQYLGGTFVLTPEAESVEEAWYMKRPRPADESLIPTWKREHD